MELLLNVNSSRMHVRSSGGHCRRETGDAGASMALRMLVVQCICMSIEPDVT